MLSRSWLSRALLSSSSLRRTTLFSKLVEKLPKDTSRAFMYLQTRDEIRKTQREYSYIPSQNSSVANYWCTITLHAHQKQSSVLFCFLNIYAVFHTGLMIESLKFQKWEKKLEIFLAGGRRRVRSLLKSQDNPKLPADMMGMLRFRPISKLQNTHQMLRDLRFKWQGNCPKTSFSWIVWQVHYLFSEVKMLFLSCNITLCY